MRVSKKGLNFLFDKLCLALGKKRAGVSRHAGDWELVEDDIWGWQILEIGEWEGTTYFPFGTAGLKTSEIATMIEWALRAIELKDGGKRE